MELNNRNEKQDKTNIFIIVEEKISFYFNSLKEMKMNDEKSKNLRL